MTESQCSREERSSWIGGRNVCKIIGLWRYLSPHLANRRENEVKTSNVMSVRCVMDRHLAPVIKRPRKIHHLRFCHSRFSIPFFKTLFSFTFNILGELHFRFAKIHVLTKVNEKVTQNQKIYTHIYTVDSLLTGLNGTGSKPVKRNSG